MIQWLFSLKLKKESDNMKIKTLLKSIGAENIETYKNKYNKTSYKFTHLGREIHASFIPETEVVEDYYNINTGEYNSFYENKHVTGEYKVCFFNPLENKNKWFIYNDKDKTWKVYKKTNKEMKVSL